MDLTLRSSLNKWDNVKAVGHQEPPPSTKARSFRARTRLKQGQTPSWQQQHIKTSELVTHQTRQDSKPILIKDENASIPAHQMLQIELIRSCARNSRERMIQGDLTQWRQMPQSRTGTVTRYDIQTPQRQHVLAWNWWTTNIERAQPQEGKPEWAKTRDKQMDPIILTSNQS